MALKAAGVAVAPRKTRSGKILHPEFQNDAPAQKKAAAKSSPEKVNGKIL